MVPPFWTNSGMGTEMSGGGGERVLLPRGADRSQRRAQFLAADLGLRNDLSTLAVRAVE
jgi:hypothetical protein